jgi:ribosome-associated protein
MKPQDHFNPRARDLVPRLLVKQAGNPAPLSARIQDPRQPEGEPRAVIVRETPIELCQFLKFGGLAGSGGEAKQHIAEGKVLVNGAVETRKRKKLAPGDKVTFDGQTLVVQVAAP